MVLNINNNDNETVKLNDQFWKSIINNNEEKYYNNVWVETLLGDTL